MANPGLSHARTSTEVSDGRLPDTRMDSRPVDSQGGLNEYEHSRSRSSSGKYTIASPPGGIDRLLFELEHGSIDSLQRRDTALQSHGNGAYAHRRSSTLNNISIGPRSSSMRRRHQSFDFEAQQRCRSVADHGRAIGLEPVVEHPTALRTKSELGSRARLPLKREDTDAAPPPKRDIARGDASRNAPARLHRLGRLHSPVLTNTLSAFIVIYQALFFTFEASFLWNVISPTLPLVAAALFLVLDMLVLQTRLIPSVRRDLFLWEAVTLVFAMAYCSSMSAFKIVEFVRSPDRGAAAPGIHFHPARSGGGDPLQEVLRDTPFSAALFATGILGVIVGLVLVLAVLLLKRRQCRG